MIRVKICGMADVEDVRVCAAAGADALGFIFAASPRRLTLENGSAQAVTAAAPPFVTCVGVFANDTPELIHAAIAQCRLDVLQFSGDESSEFCGSFGKPTILSVRSRSFSGRDLVNARAIALLVDASDPYRYGGTGRTADGAAFARARAEHPDAFLILAGGLAPANVASLARRSRPDAVDVRTGVERGGRKDPELVRSFVDAARSVIT
jgi:phosphoribosylanthranilate isomerase